MSNYSGLGARCGNEELSSPQGNGATVRVITRGKRHETCEQDNFGDAADSEARQFPACANTGCAWKPVKKILCIVLLKGCLISSSAWR